MRQFKVLICLALLSGIVYLGWLSSNLNSPIGVLYFGLEAAMYLLLVTFAFNHWRRRFEVAGGDYNLRSRVDVFIPTKGEPLNILSETLQAAKKIIFPHIKVYVLDDGHSRRVETLAKKLGVTYLSRPDADTRAYKAANLNFGLHNTHGNFILVLDADQVVQSNILDDLMGHFRDSRVALVSTRQAFKVSKGDFNHDGIFYGHMQAGKNAHESGLSCGSGVIYRRSALEKIGGFQEWNLVEDLYTTYVLNEHGFTTRYISQAYTIGLAPTKLSTIARQRGTWALDALRLFFWRYPLINLRLKLRQRVHYFEMGYVYIVSGIVLPLLFALNFYSLGTNEPLVEKSIWFLLLKIPSFYLVLRFYNYAGEGTSSTRMWAGLFPVYFQAILRALLYKKPQYRVTPKVEASSNEYKYAIPQFVFLVAGLVFLTYHFYIFGFTSVLVVNFFWLIVMAYWIFPILKLATTNFGKSNRGAI